MSGRAGRRGKDTQGYVVTLQTRFEGAKEASALAISKPNALEKSNSLQAMEWYLIFYKVIL